MRELQTLRVTDGARNDLPAGSVLANYRGAFRREYGLAPPRMLGASELRAMDGALLDDAYAAMSDRLTTTMRKHGFDLDETACWTSDMSLFITEADVQQMVRWAVAFRSHGVAQAEARVWWNRFTSLHWSLRYRARRHTPESAREVFWAVPRFERHDWHWTPTMLETANSWVMTALPLERVRAYLRLRVSPREALREWEPRPDCAGTIAFMLALTPGVVR